MKLSIAAYELLLRILRNPLVVPKSSGTARSLIERGFAQWNKRGRLEITEQGRTWLKR